MKSQLFRFLTTSVGLVVAKREHGVNVMSAEWTYFVAREPLHIAVGINDDAYTQRLVEEAGEFSVTLCSASQASIANFAGSVSGADIDKTSSRRVELVPAVVTSTPRVAGGVLSAECRLVAALDLPGYKLLVGEALAVRTDERENEDPLVKHGGMYRLGEPICDDAIAAAAEIVADDAGAPVVRVAASVQAGERQGCSWRVSIVSPDRSRLLLGEAASNGYGDMMEEFSVSDLWPGVALSQCQIVVERADTRPGWAAISAMKRVVEIAGRRRARPAPRTRGSAPAEFGVRAGKEVTSRDQEATGAPLLLEQEVT